MVARGRGLTERCRSTKKAREDANEDDASIKDGAGIECLGGWRWLWNVVVESGCGWVFVLGGGRSGDVEWTGKLSRA